MLIWPPYFVISEWSDYGILTLIAGVPFWLFFYLTFRDVFCPLVINEKGITSKLPFRNIFIAWDEMEHISVGAQRGGKEGKYKFAIHFSKIQLKENDIFKSKVPLKHKKERFIIVYRDGLLEEILKYIDGKKVQNMEWIRNCPDPCEWQRGFNELVNPYEGKRLKGKRR